MSPHSIAKSAAKPIFSPLPHPTFFAPKSPFSPLFSVLSPFSDDFSRARPRFLPCEAHFFLVFPHPDPKLWGFFEEYFTILPPPTAFSIHAPPSLPPPLSFSFLPTFPSPSPINARTRALTRSTRVRVRPHTPARQEVFVYCLHRFTHPSQSTVHQHVRGEEKREKAFTKHSTTSQSIY